MTTTLEGATADDLRRYLYGAVQALCSAVDTARVWEHRAPDRATQRVVATCMAATAPDTAATADDCLSRINSATHAYLRVLRHIRPRHYAHMAPAGRDFVPWRPLAEMRCNCNSKDNDNNVGAPRHDNEKVLGLLTCALQGLGAALRDALRLGGDVAAPVQTLVRLVCAAQRAHVSGLRAWNMCAECGAATLAALECAHAQRRARFGAPDTAAHVHWVPSAAQCGGGAPAVLVCGRSLAALKGVLDAAQGTDVRVYTHGALLAAHLRARLRQYRALAGHYGRHSSRAPAAAAELAAFPGPVLLTAGCGSNIVGALHAAHRVVCTRRVFTCAPVGGRAARPVINGDYAPLLRAAAAFPGVGSSSSSHAPTATRTVRDTPGVVAAHAAEVAAALRAGTLRRVFVACGVRVPALAARLPPDCMVLVFAACSSSNDDEEEEEEEDSARWGMVPGTALPRVVHMGSGDDEEDALEGIVLGVRAMQEQQHAVPALPLTVLVRCVAAETVAPLLALAHAGVRSTYYATTTLPALARPASTLARFLRHACGLARLESVPALLADTLPQSSPVPNAVPTTKGTTTNNDESAEARLASAVEI